jgi:cytochrome c biogenesis protein CcdA
MSGDLSLKSFRRSLSSKNAKHILFILIAVTVLLLALSNAVFSTVKVGSGEPQSDRTQIQRDLGAIPLAFEPTSGVFSDNKTHVIFLFSTTCPACEDSTKRSINELYLTWRGNLTYKEVSLNLVNYYREKDVGEAYFKAFNIPRNQTSGPVLVVHNSRVGLIYYPPFENMRVQQGVYYLTRGSLIEAVQKEKETSFSQPLIYALGTVSGFNPCLFALASFFFASATHTELKRVARRVGLISLGLVYAYVILFSVIVLNPTVMEYLAASAWLVASILVVVGLLHFVEVAQDLHSRRWGSGNYMEAKVPLFKTPQSIKGFIVKIRELNNPVYDFLLGMIFSLMKLPCIAMLFVAMLVNSTAPITDTMIFTIGVASPVIVMGVLIGFGMVNVNRLSLIRFKGRSIQRTVIGAALLISAVLVLS